MYLVTHKISLPQSEKTDTTVRQHFQQMPLKYFSLQNHFLNLLKVLPIHLSFSHFNGRFSHHHPTGLGMDPEEEIEIN